MRTIAVLALALTLVCGAARGEVDVLMRAIGFALTGSDDAEPKAIDRAKCVFGIKKNVYRLNNVHTDRIVIHGWQRKSAVRVEHWVTVALHGDDVVFELTTEPMKDDGSEYLRDVRAANPE